MKTMKKSKIAPKSDGFSTSALHYSPKSIPPSVHEALAIAQVSAVTGGYALDFPPTDDYKAVKLLIAGLRGVWTGKTHLFAYNPTHLLSEVLKAGKYPELNPYALFETPDDGIEDLFKIADIPEGEEYQLRILEPSAGPGKIAIALRERLPNCIIDCVELDPVNRSILEAEGFNVIGSDFMTTEILEKYDYVVMNPPFQRDTWLKHIMKAYGCVKDWGVVAAIAPSNGVLHGQDFRNFVAARGYYEELSCVFKDTKTKCLGMKIERVSKEFLESMRQPYNRYASKYEYNLHEVLSSMHEYCDGVRDARVFEGDERRERVVFEGEELRKRVGCVIDTVVRQLIVKEVACIFYDQTVKDQLIETAISCDLGE